MNRKYACAIVAVSICIIICLSSGCSKDSETKDFLASSGYEFDINPLEIGKIGNHIYYPEGVLFDGIDFYPGEEAALRKSLEEKDKGQFEKLYVFNYICDQSPGGELHIQLYGREYVNGVVLEDRPYYAQSEADTDRFTKMFAGRRKHYPSKISVIKPEKIIPDVEMLAIQNSYQMLMDRGNTIYGTYILKGYAYSGQLYYEFKLNRYSYVNVDAKTGEILEYEFFDGYSDAWYD